MLGATKGGEEQDNKGGRSRSGIWEGLSEWRGGMHADPRQRLLQAERAASAKAKRQEHSLCMQERARWPLFPVPRGLLGLGRHSAHVPMTGAGVRRGSGRRGYRVVGRKVREQSESH